MQNFSRVIGIVLGAGQGKRVQKFTTTPKVLLPLQNKPLIQYGLDILKSYDIPAILIVKYRKEEIINKLGNKYLYIEQKTHPGTGGAIRASLYGYLNNQKKFPAGIDTILILQGDDTAFLTNETIEKLLITHFEKKSVLSVLTTIRKNPTGFGRIIRSKSDVILKIVEEKNATIEQKNVHEINTGVWVFDIAWLRKHIRLLKRNEISKEYYATDLLEIAVNNGFVPNSYTCSENEFFGINTEEEYKQAIKLKEQILCPKKKK